MSSTGNTDVASLRPEEAAARRQELVARLARVEAAITRWEAFDADQWRPPNQRRRIEPPAVPRDGLITQRRDLLAEIDQLDAVYPPPRRY